MELRWNINKSYYSRCKNRYHYRTILIKDLLLPEEDDVDVTVKSDGRKTKVFTEKGFEKKFFSEATNRVLCKTFIENALRDPITNEIGKSIVFCVNVQHARKITEILNDFAEQKFPGKYNSDFAVQITSNVVDAQQMTINFANNNLMGHTRWLEDYESSKARLL